MTDEPMPARAPLSAPIIAEVVVATPDVVVVKTGRRKSDVQAFAATSRHVLFYVFGMFLDERHKPSMSRIMLALWTWTGWLMVEHELRLHPGDVSLSNAAWTAWWAAEGMLALAVFGPSIASYFGAGAAGAVSGIGASIRDAITEVKEKL
jgi:hypothetical protein